MRIVAKRGFFVVALSLILDTPICPRGSHATRVSITYRTSLSRGSEDETMLTRFAR